MLITNGTLITFGANPRVSADGALLIKGESIKQIGTTAELAAQHPDEETLDARGQIVMPGNICGHTHFYSAFARGMAVPGEPAKNFVEILEKLWWRLDKALTLEDVRSSALTSLVDAIRNGTTCLIDHHASPNAIDGSLDAIAGAARQAGVRVSCAYEVTDRDGPERARAGIAENVRFIQQQKQRPDSLLGASFGLHASFTLSKATLRACTDAAKQIGSGFHVHVAEDKADQVDCLQKYELRVVERFEKNGVLGPNTVAAHCIHLDAYEMAMLRETRTKVTHQPRSNMNNAVGTQRSLELLKRGICLGLGNDGFSNNMFAEMKAAYLLHKQTSGDPRVMGADQVMRMAVVNNAQIAKLFWQQPLGELSPGACADVILLDYVPPTPLTVGNMPWHVIFGVDGTHVATTICAGKVLMKDRVLLTLDEAGIAAEARQRATSLWERI
jgi:putative selenium metabolism protein SsnA